MVHPQATLAQSQSSSMSMQQLRGQFAGAQFHNCTMNIKIYSHTMPMNDSE